MAANFTPLSLAGLQIREKQMSQAISEWDLTLYHTVPTFNNTEKKKASENIAEKQKMLVTCIFSFSHNVFFPETEIIILATFNLLSAKALDMVKSKKLSFGKA